jgi:hypothetical protein
MNGPQQHYAREMRTVGGGERITGMKNTAGWQRVDIFLVHDRKERRCIEKLESLGSILT